MIHGTKMCIRDRRCDEEGILVWAEVPFISILSDNKKADENIREQMRRLILQCGNHTSIYCWGVQNEITIAGENKEIHASVESMAAYTKELDADRYTAEANIYSVANESALNRMTELVGYNLYYGWYYDEITGLQKRLDEFHAACPDIPPVSYTHLDVYKRQRYRFRQDWLPL